MTIRLESPLGIIAHHAMWQCSWSNRSLDKMFDEPNKLAAKGKHAFPDQRSFACLSRSDFLNHTYPKILQNHCETHCMYTSEQNLVIRLYEVQSNNTLGGQNIDPPPPHCYLMYFYVLNPNSNITTLKKWTFPITFSNEMATFKNARTLFLSVKCLLFTKLNIYLYLENSI